MIGLAPADAVLSTARGYWRPPPKLSLSEWADQHFYLSAESSAQAGRWTTIPYQKGIMDAFTDPGITFVIVMKSARIGWTKIVNALVGYSIDQDPASILVVQPTVDDAKGYSKEEIAPMIRDCPRLSKAILEEQEEAGPRDSGNTILHKTFRGGVLSLVGANSGAGLRRISRKRVLFDEVDAYPSSAGAEGDPIKLGIRRAEHFWDRKIGAGSTPLIAGLSRIEQLFLAGDQRRYKVPCPQCGHVDHLVFRARVIGGVHVGHYMEWPEKKPEEAHFVCSKNGCVIEHQHKRDMIAAGHWHAEQPFTGSASFHIWAAYSYSPNATWGQIAAEFLEAQKGGVEQLKTFVNTVLGESWQERGEAPDWERLYQRREHYEIGTVPAPAAKFLTCGVDVQKDRFVYEVVAWAPGRESWSVDAGVIPCDTGAEAAWLQLDELIARTYPGPRGTLPIAMTAIDSGYNSQSVYNWCRRHERNRVIAIKGVATSRSLVGAPTPVDVHHNGRRIARGAKVWPVGVDVAKSEFYGFLRLPQPVDGAPYPPGFCHFPQLGPDYFKQITAEHLVKIAKRTGHVILEWQVIPNRENHWLDCRVYARAAASVCGVDRMVVATNPGSDSRVFECHTPGCKQLVPVSLGRVHCDDHSVETPARKPIELPGTTPKPRSDSRFTLRPRSGKSWLR